MPRFRRKNRQLKMVVDVPEDFDSDEEFMDAFMSKLDMPADDGTSWQFTLGDDNDVPVPINRVTLGEVEIEPEDDDEEED